MICSYVSPAMVIPILRPSSCLEQQGEPSRAMIGMCRLKLPWSGPSRNGHQTKSMHSQC